MAARPATPVALAVVHHANQYLLADGYDNRQGLAEIVDGYLAVLALHERYGVPAALHLSGTLVEAAAWGRPDFLDAVRRLRDAGLVRLVGGAWGENVMPLFDRPFNRAQLEEAFIVYEELLGCRPRELRTCWVPERVWDTAALAPVLADPTLRNGGYRRVLVDDRLLFPAGEARAAFDGRGPYGAGGAGEPAPPEACGAYRIAEGAGLTACPISANLRYWVPPHTDEQEQLFGEQVRALAGQPDALLVYGDDMEKTAGVAGWRVEVERFEGFLARLAGRNDVEAVHLDTWLDEHPPGEQRALEPGTFYELAQVWGAGEDYRGWAEAPDWQPYAAVFASAQAAVGEAEAGGGDQRLLQLARKHLLASAHETAWRDSAEGGGRAVAPWARALASHARHALVVAEAARLLAGSGREAVATVRDLDDDGEEEVLLAAGGACAVLSPLRGGRLLYLFHRLADGGVLSLGNPTDHWNFQEELNRFMDVPPNHPGGLADAGAEHDDHWVVKAGTPRGGAAVELVNAARGSHLSGARKLVALQGGGLVARYELPPEAREAATELCLSPDYARLLGAGRRALESFEGPTWRGWRNGEAAIWVALDPAEPTRFGQSPRPEPGHGLLTRVEARAATFHLLLGWGETGEERCRELLEQGRRALEGFRRSGQTFGPGEADAVEAAYGLAGVRLLGYLQGSAALLASDRGELVIRLCRGDPEGLAHRLGLTRYLARHGFPTPELLETVDGDALVLLRGEPYDLHVRAPGGRVSRLEPGQARAAGEALARLHLLGAAYPVPLGGRATLLERLTEERRRIHEAEASIDGAAALRSELAAIASHLDRVVETLAGIGYERLPASVVHGDYRRSNLLFDGDRVTAVLDLDECRRDARTADLGIALASLARGEGDAFLDPRLVRALVDGYRSSVELQDAEAEALPALVEAGFVQAALVRARRLDRADPAALAKRAAKLGKHAGRLRRLDEDPSWRGALA